MLCAACEGIFCQTYLLGSSKKIAWKQDLESFHHARSSGCHICNILWVQVPQHTDTAELTAAHFPCHYSFELHNADWARWGQEPEYLEVQTAGEEIELFAEERAGNAKARFGAEYSVYKLRYILKKDCDRLRRGNIQMWAVFTFYILDTSIRFPLQVYHGGAVEEIAQRRLADQNNTGSAETLELARYWLSQCMLNHPQCKSVYADSSWHPHRLIYVGTPDNPCLRLVSGSQLSPDTKYATLSHCWGTFQHCIVTKETLAAFFEVIPPDTLSKTAQDAVRVTRSLGLQHLWIDGLCIIQNDKEDWHAQSAQMSKVYGFSSCTIAAAASQSGEDSFLCSRNQFAVRPCKIPNPFGEHADIEFQISTRSLGLIFDEEAKSTKWHNRGWVFQERLLSQRLLIFGSRQIMWSCQQMSAAESWPSGRTSKHHIDRFESFEAEKLELHQLLNVYRELHVADDHWESLVRRYTRTEMTKPSDRLVALQGIASRVIDVTGRKYSFGLWIDKTLPQSLLWHLSTTMVGSARVIDNAPSWSWGSVVGPIDFLDDQARLAQVYVRLTESRSSHDVSSDSTTRLEIHGPLFGMTLALHPSKQYFKLRRDEHFEIHRRMSMHPNMTFPMHHKQQLSENRWIQAKRRLSASIKRARAVAADILHVQRRLLRWVWSEGLYSYILTGLAKTQPWREKAYWYLIRPIASCLVLIWWSFVLLPLSLVAFICTLIWENKYLSRPLRCIVLTAEWFLTCLWTWLTALAKCLWSPIRWIGCKIYGDPDWDWILLWNITIPFPYFFPGIFGPLRSRPRTPYEWMQLRGHNFILETSQKMSESVPYDEWIARIIPDSSTPFIDADCWLDIAPGDEEDLQVNCLLVLRRHQIHGLLLRRITGHDNHYQRIGMFKCSKYESCFAWPEEAMQTIVLV